MISLLVEVSAAALFIAFCMMWVFVCSYVIFALIHILWKWVRGEELH